MGNTKDPIFLQSRTNPPKNKTGTGVNLGKDITQEIHLMKGDKIVRKQGGARTERKIGAGMKGGGRAGRKAGRRRTMTAQKQN